MRAFEFEIKGIQSLLMHRDNLDADDEVAEWLKDSKNKKMSRAGDDRFPAWKWMGYLYHDTGVVTIPSDNLRACLRQAAAQITLKGMKTFKEYSQTAIWFEDEHFPLLAAGKPVPLGPIEAIRDDGFGEQAAAVRKLGFVLDQRRARVGQGKHVRVRPRFDAWGFAGSFEVRVEEKHMPAEVVREMFAIAGRLGLGDFRPGCKTPGRFGQFTATVKEVR